MKTLKYIAIYSLLFMICYVGCFGIYFYLAGVEGISFMDTLNMQYQTFVYLGDYLRFILAHHQVPLWDYTMGYGADILPTITTHLWDPFCWLAVFFEGQQSEYAYQITCILKLYASGLAFSAFCFYRKHPWPYVLSGAITYTFSGTAYIVFTQMYLLNPLYLFPLLILSVDRLFNEKKYGFYILMLTWCLISYFYLAYMMCLLTGFYIISLSVSEYLKKRNFKEILLKLSKIGFVSIIALGLSAIVLWPVIDVLTGQNRLTTPYVVQLLKPILYYYQLGMNFILPFDSGADSYIGLGIIALPCLILLFLKEGNKRLKTEFICLTLGLCLPIFGYMMNGFVYSNNRWIFGYEFLVAYIIVVVLPLIQKSDFKKICVVLCCYSLFVMVLGFCTQNKYTGVLLNTPLLFISAVLVTYIITHMTPQKQNQKSVFLLIICVLSTLLPYYCAHISFSKFDAIWRMVPVDTAYQTLTTSHGLPLIKKVIQKENIRYNHNFSVHILPHHNPEKDESIANSSWIARVMGTDFYRNIYNNNIEIFHDAIALVRSPFAGSYHNLNARTELMALFGVKYYIERNDRKETVPPHYNVVVAQDKVGGVDYTVYQSSSDVSLIYGFDKTISLQDFESLSPDMRQQALLQSLIVDEKYVNAQKNDLELKDNKIKYQIYLSGDSSKIIPDLKLSDYGSIFNLSFEPTQNVEMYAYISEPKIFPLISLYHLFFSFAKRQYEVLYSTPKVHMYIPNQNRFINFGYTSNPENHVKITLSHIQKEYFDQIDLYARPISQIEENIQNLKPLGKDLKLDVNKMSFTVDLEKDQFVFISVPYSKGWRAYIDGSPAEIIQADIAFMALKIKQGKHQVEFVYQTPRLKGGLLVSVISLILLTILGIFRLKNKKKSS